MISPVKLTVRVCYAVEKLIPKKNLEELELTKKDYNIILNILIMLLNDGYCKIQHQSILQNYYYDTALQRSRCMQRQTQK